MAEDDTADQVATNPLDWASTSARLAGYGWDEISGWFNSELGAGKAAGHSENDMLSAIGLPAPDAHAASLASAAQVDGAYDPTKFDALKAADGPPVTPLEAPMATRIADRAGVLPPTPAMPEEGHDGSTPIDFNDEATRGAYADALRTGAARTPAEFAERYAGAYLGAAATQLPEVTGSAQAAVVRAAGGLSATLPTNEDLTDIAIGIAHSAGIALTPDSVARVKNNLAEDWVATNKPLQEMYQRAQVDPDYAEKMVAPSPPSTTDSFLTAMTAPVEYLLGTLINGPGLEPVKPGSGTGKQYAGFSAEADAILKDPTAYYNSQSFDGLPPDTQQAVRAFASGKAQPVSMAMVADEVALINSKSVGEAAENFAYDVGSLYGLNKAIEWVIAPAGRYVINQVKGFFPSAATPFEDAVMEEARVQWRSIMPEGPTLDQAVTHYSPDALLDAAREQGPVHAEAARIAVMPTAEREAALTALEKTAVEEGAQAVDKPVIDRAAVEELLPAYDAAGGVYKWAQSLVHDILNEEDGALKLFHGTGVQFAAERGAPFGRFQMEKIGAGEGAQLYSHGLYFAQDERVSRWYRDMDVSRKGAPTSDGSLFTVHVDVDPATQMLDWDRKLIDQHAAVQKMLASVAPLREWAEKQAAAHGGSADNILASMTGEDLYKRLMQEKGATAAQTALPAGAPNRLASEALREAGFKGMQYADAATRGMPFAQRSFNHVIYDPSVVKITHRNGQPVPANTLFADLQGLMAEGASKVAGVLESVHSRLPNWDTPARSIEKALYDARREAGRTSMIRNFARADQTVQETAFKLDKLRGLVDKHVPEFEAATAAHDVPRAMNSVVGQLISYIENRGLGATLQNSKMQVLADALRDVNLAQRGRLQQAFNDGLIGLDEYRENYYRHLWKNPRGPEWDKLWTGGVPRQGSGQSLLQRTLPTIEDGLQAGLIPRISDPIDLALYDIGQKSRYLGALRTIDEATQAGHAYRSVSGPEAPTDAPLLGLKGSIPVGPGMSSVLYGKSGFHELYNNAFSNGMFNHPGAAGTYEKLQWAANTSTAMKLALPIFHMRVVGLASVASGIGQALEEAGRGQFAKAALHSVEAVGWLPRIGIDAKVGFTQLSNFKNSMSDPIVQGLTDAGLRIGGGRQVVYREGAESLITTGLRGVVRGNGFVDAMTTENLKGFGGAIVRAIGKDIRDVGGDAEVETIAKRIALGVPRAALLPVKEMGRIMMTATAPFFDHLIPALKVGAGYRRMQSWLADNPFVSDEAKAIKFREVVKSLDNRFGELNQDTIFVPRLAKQIANATLISPGWVYGSYRGFLGAMGVDVEKIYASGRGFQNPLNFRNASTVVLDTVGTVAAFSIFNTLEQYARTGTFPWQTDTPWHDLIAYRSGGVTSKGIERGGIPTELKEVFDVAKILATGIAGYTAGGGGWQGTAIGVGRAAGASAEYVLAKVNPFLQAIKTIFSGEDAIGHHVLTPAGFSKFMKSAFKPIFLDAIAAEKKGSAFGLISALMGDRAAPVASNWDGFIKQMEGVFAKENKAEANRVKYENAGLANPDPEVGTPSAARQPGQGRGTGTGRAARAYDQVGRGRGSGLDPWVSAALQSSRAQRGEEIVRDAQGNPTGYILRGGQNSPRQDPAARSQQAWLNTARAHQDFVRRSREVAGGAQGVGPGGDTPATPAELETEREARQTRPRQATVARGPSYRAPRASRTARRSRR